MKSAKGSCGAKTMREGEVDKQASPAYANDPSSSSASYPFFPDVARPPAAPFKLVDLSGSGWSGKSGTSPPPPPAPPCPSLLSAYELARLCVEYWELVLSLAAGAPTFGTGFLFSSLLGDWADWAAWEGEAGGE